MFRNDLRLAVITLIGGVILMVISPWLWTLPSHFGVSFLHTGEVGDTIGGSTAPIVGLIGAILLFLALKAQIRANQIVMDQMRDQRELDSYQKLSSYMLQQVQLIRDDMNEFSITRTITTGPSGNRIKQTFHYRGVEAIVEALDTAKDASYDHEVKLIDIPEFARIHMILERLNFLVQDISTQSLNDVDRTYLLGAARFTYNARLKPVLQMFEKHRANRLPPCPTCGKVHAGLAEEIYQHYDKLNVLLN
jgi:hypothetical protein